MEAANSTLVRGRPITAEDHAQRCDCPNGPREARYQCDPESSVISLHCVGLRCRPSQVVSSFESPQIRIQLPAADDTGWRVDASEMDGRGASDAGVGLSRDMIGPGSRSHAGTGDGWTEPIYGVHQQTHVVISLVSVLAPKSVPANAILHATCMLHA